ncbi:hypothetical protein BC834DRAFT_502929 [Gloeopeniophorella convolvens]|nr:hypothetical protein BC834DRAFT_502929 [Gloeopeniophorella convolvens]
MAQTTETGSMHAAQNVPGGDQPETRFSDGSGAIFSFYLEKAEKDDDEMAERWKGGADSILVFVCPHRPQMSIWLKFPSDRSFLCNCRRFLGNISPEPEPELSRHIRLLPRPPLSAFGCRERQRLHIPSSTLRPLILLALPVCHLGQHALVPQSHRQSELCAPRDITATVGATVSSTHQTGLCFPRARTGPQLP